jgi:hypothetical protein
MAGIDRRGGFVLDGGAAKPAAASMMRLCACSPEEAGGVNSQGLSQPQRERTPHIAASISSRIAGTTTLRACVP